MDDDHAGLRAALHEAKEAGDISLQEYLRAGKRNQISWKFPGNLRAVTWKWFPEICDNKSGNLAH